MINLLDCFHQITKRLLLAFLTLLLLVSGTPQKSLAKMFSHGKSVEDIHVRLERLPENAMSRKKAKLYTDLGTLYYWQGQMEKGAVAYEKALLFDTTKKLRKSIFLYMGKCYESHGRLDKAILAYEKAIRYDPKNWKRYRDVGWLYERAQLYDKAVENYKTAITFHSNIPSVHFSLARVYRKMGLYHLAESQLKISQEMGNQSFVLYRELSIVMEGRGRHEEAARIMAERLGKTDNFEEWARVVYLAALADNRGLANEGLAILQNLDGNKKSILFYEGLVDLLSDHPADRNASSVYDPDLRALIQSVLKP